MSWACACRTRCTDCGTPTCLERTPAALCEPCGQPTCGECDHECEATP